MVFINFISVLVFFILEQQIKLNETDKSFLFICLFVCLNTNVELVLFLYSV